MGASPLVPPIPGIENPNVIEVIDAHTNRLDEIKGEIVILGGGLSGCDFALELAQRGNRVTIVEMADKLAAKCNWTSRSALLGQLKKNQVIQLTGCKVVAFEENIVIIERQSGNQEKLPMDIAIVALGTRSNQKAAQEICEKYANAVMIGDCKQVSQVGNGMHDAYQAVWMLEGDRTEKEKILKKRAKEEKFRLRLSSILMPNN